MAKRRAMGSNVLDAVAGIEDKAPAPVAPPAGAVPGSAEKPKSAPATVRQSYHMDAGNVEKIRAAAWWDRSTVSDVVNEAVRQYVERMEKKQGGPYKPVAEVRRGRPIR
jgi:hypothetical protein